LFEDPFRYCDSNRSKTEIFTDANRKIAREIAAQSFVLLKNKGNLLPLKKNSHHRIDRPLADAKENMTGTWSVAANFSRSISVLAGLQAAVGSNGRVIYAKGSNLDADSLFELRAGMFGKAFKRDSRTPQQIIDEALAIANQSDVVVAALGESCRR
jgi:beta-glucosidase